MAIINPDTYEFNSLQNVMDFVRPLLIEGVIFRAFKLYELRNFKPNDASLVCGCVVP